MKRFFGRGLFSYLTLLFCICLGGNALLAQEDLYDLDQIVEIELTIEDEYWHKKLITFKEKYQKKRVLGSVKINGVQFDSIGIRFKGNSSFFSPYRAGLDKLPLNLKLTYRDDNQEYDGRYRTMKLSNVFRDPSFVRETLSYTIARTYVPAPAANYARVTVNGDYWGLYNLTQSIDEQFQEDHYGSQEGLLVKCDPSWQESEAIGCAKGDKANLEYLGNDAACYIDKYELKRTKKGWDELVELTRVLNLEGDKLEEIMNIDEALWMLAFNNVLVNLDSYSGRLCHNYYLYQDTFKIWHPLLWDMNLSMGGFRFTGMGGRLSNEQMANMSIFLHLKEKNKRRPLILQLLSRPLYRKIYVAHVKTIYEDYLKEDQYVDLGKEMRAQIRELVAADSQKLYSMEAFEANFAETVIVDGNQEIVGVQELLEGRKSYFESHPLIKAACPEIIDHSVQMADDEVEVNLQLAGDGEAADQVWLMYRAVANGPWSRMPLEKTAAENYTATLKSSAILEYYFIAEGSKTATVLPARSGKEWFSVTEG